MGRQACALQAKARATADNLWFILPIRSNCKSRKALPIFPGLSLYLVLPSVAIDYLNFKRVALLADIDALRLADAIGAARRFVNVAAEKIGGLFASDPFAQSRAAGMFAGCEFVESGIERGKMHDEM